MRATREEINMLHDGFLDITEKPVVGGVLNGTVPEGCKPIKGCVSVSFPNITGVLETKSLVTPSVRYIVQADGLTFVTYLVEPK